MTRASLAKPGCQEKCGNLTIPYPFGIGTNCYSHKSFEVMCDGSAEDIAPLRFVNNHIFPILEISTEWVSVVHKVYLTYGNKSGSKPAPLDRYFRYSHDKNVYVALGCDCYVFFQVPHTGSGTWFNCTSMCDQILPDKNISDICNGMNRCCQSSVPVGTSAFSVVKRNSEGLEMCSAALITEKNITSILSNREIIRNSSVALNWFVALHTCREAQKRGNSLCGRNSHCVDSNLGIGYNCRCIDGYEGNPYLPTGCKDKMEKATDSFSRHRIIGKGGQGTVYKGLLQDGTVVAIKKSNIIDEDEVARFVNEVLILAQISHRNIVKLLGCCLEYEVPLLVYEYLSNVTLSQHLHDGSQVSIILWKDRVRIAKEVAEALAYLHSYASPTIFHRDIKPRNILLDKNYNAVVSDFGISRSVPISRSHLTTQIEGTFGYLDPEYFQSGKLTSKSDVYAFGVILTELLTRRRAVSPINSGEGLVPRFQDLIKHNHVISILDMQVVQEARMDDILLLAKLANRCMKKNAKKRPSMKEVVAKFDQLKVVQLEFPHQGVSEDECTF
ncbi:putative wall-associated receptor kinase-like 16 [Rutidosis leptorrhynchoides]|uniref:putative wall-associated receptor kinase-like 16 n=1 Tax=Rutidosis leptorrhynchoides TaxID=125765 RepID=UPI003A9A150A